MLIFLHYEVDCIHCFDYGIYIDKMSFEHHCYLLPLSACSGRELCDWQFLSMEGATGPRPHDSFMSCRGRMYLLVSTT